MTHWVVPIPFQDWLAFAMAPFIFLPLTMYRRYRARTMTVLDESVLLHEQTHIVRQRAQGLALFGWKYVTNKNFRLYEELFAINVQMQFLKSHGETYNIERMAHFFASPTYGYLLTYEQALQRLTQLWETGIL